MGASKGIREADRGHAPLQIMADAAEGQIEVAPRKKKAREPVEGPVPEVRRDMHPDGGYQDQAKGGGGRECRKIRKGVIFPEDLRGGGMAGGLFPHSFRGLHRDDLKSPVCQSPGIPS